MRRLRAEHDDDFGDLAAALEQLGAAATDGKPDRESIWRAFEAKVDTDDEPTGDHAAAG